MQYPSSFVVALAGNELEWYALLTSALTPEQTADIQKLFVTADQRKAAAGIQRVVLRSYILFENIQGWVTPIDSAV